MGVKIECNICEKPIRTVRPEDVGSITGKEICNTCGARIDAVFGLIDKEVAAFNSELLGMQESAKKKYLRLDDVYNNYQNKANDLFLRTRKELESLKANVIANEMSGVRERKTKSDS